MNESCVKPLSILTYNSLNLIFGVTVLDTRSLNGLPRGGCPLLACCGSKRRFYYSRMSLFPFHRSSILLPFYGTDEISASATRSAYLPHDRMQDNFVVNRSRRHHLGLFWSDPVVPNI